MKRTAHIIVPFVLFGAVACGADQRSYDAQLEAPSPTEARVSISAALDLSQILDSSLADRVVIEDITVNLGEVRLLAADPRIPPGGFSLLENDTLLEFYGHEDSRLELAFPDKFLVQQDLAVYLRINPAANLDDASIVITGRMYASPIDGGQNALNAKTGALDPDGDPVDDPDADPTSDKDSAENEEDEKVEGLDPDGDPVLPSIDYDCALDPDGDPVMCSSKASLTRGTAEQESVAFVLRADDIADLVASLDPDAALNVVVGIPASRWFTPEVVASLDQVLEERAEDPGEMRENDETDAEKIIVVEAQDEADRAANDRMEHAHGDDYFIDNRDLDDLTVR